MLDDTRRSSAPWVSLLALEPGWKVCFHFPDSPSFLSSPFTEWAEDHLAHFSNKALGEKICISPASSIPHGETPSCWLSCARPPKELLLRRVDKIDLRVPGVLGIISREEMERGLCMRCAAFLRCIRASLDYISSINREKSRFGPRITGAV